MSSAAFLRLDQLGKRFAGREVLRALELELAAGETLALLGPSGSGKTTALRLVAGFESPDSGRIWIDGEDVTPLRPARRRCGMVFQHYALFPHMTVAENVAFGLGSQAGAARSGVAARVATMLALVGLPGRGAQPVTALSGGEQQRVALARALAPSPRLLLLDEPLSNLDPTLRERTRRELRAALRAVGITTLLVTHEQDEAFRFGDRVAVLHGGHLEQVGTPEALYDAPASLFVARFIGRSSTLAARLVARQGERGTAELAGLDGHPGAVWAVRPRGDVAPGQPAIVVARPEALQLAAPGAPDALPGRILERRFGGAATTYLVGLDTLDGSGAGPEVEVSGEPGHQDGEIAAVAPAPGASPPFLFADGAA